VLKEKIVITDIGSTTTKAILLEKRDLNYKIVDYVNSQTTVEKPFEDVKIGIKKSIMLLEERNNLELLKKTDANSEVILADDCSYLTTSSAGGGLQILVVGLTLTDSANSAERAAYGVGGVLLETLAIDDKRTDIQKMHLLNSLHPDIILFCGGIDGGALFSVYRLAEILNLANPTQKFAENSKIPLVYAGNTDAVDFINTLFVEKFDLHIVPNLRPSMTQENLAPATDKIHNLFMNNVMEQAPGYSLVKKIANTDIIPTPKGVMNSLLILSKIYNKILAFDIGGATTDFFSNITGDFNRSVSANYGMSYSIGNVLAESNKEMIKSILSFYFTKDDKDIYSIFQDYIGDKVIYPEFNPTEEWQYLFEHILAVQAIKLAKDQHYKMHFKTKKIGFLDKIKLKINRDKFKETMYYPHYDESFLFDNAILDVIIGAGGVISFATVEQAIFIIAEGVKPLGVTLLCRDKHFITPHLGVLADVNPDTSANLLEKECIEKLAVYVKVEYKKYKENKHCLSLIFNNKKLDIKTNEIYVEKILESSIVKVETNENLIYSISDIKLYDDTYLVIDTRSETLPDSLLLLQKLNPYKISSKINNNIIRKNINPDLKKINKQLKLALPYKGKVFVKEGDSVTPESLLGENLFSPPKIYVVLLSSMVERSLTSEEVKNNLLIKIGQKVSVGEKIFNDDKAINMFSTRSVVYSPVRGTVERINYDTGTIILREIQDYPLKPVEVNVAKFLKIKEKTINGYMKKREGDFIYAGEVLAKKHNEHFKSLDSPYTGTIQNIDTVKGTVKICYDKEPYKILAQAYGKVIETKDDKEVIILSEVVSINAKIGFGRDIGGQVIFKKQADELSDLKDKILFYYDMPDYEKLKQFADLSIAGLVCPSINYRHISKFMGKDLGVALTGNENIPYSIIIYNSFSNSSNLIEYSNLLDSMQKIESKNNYVLLKPHTQIRAGATRPEILFF